MGSGAFSMWLTVAGGFLSYFLADGCTYSAGILFTEFKDVFHAGSTATSLLPALVYSIPQFMSPFICPFTAIVGYSAAAAWGSLFLCISFIVTSLAQEIVLTYFAYGALLSLGLQLTYTAAFMAVVSTFKDSKWLGLACGVMVCGGGMGAFATNHLLSWILSFWTWREALILQGGIFLHAWISAALFYWLDERATMQSEWEKYESYLETREVDFAVERKPPGDAPDPSAVTVRPVASVYRRVVDRLKRLWYLCPIFMILTPTRHRPRAQKHDYMRMQTSETLGAQAREFWCQLRSSYLCLFSPAVWTNAPFLIYVLTNGLAAAGVVIPWTFVYDYIRTQWTAGLDSNIGLSDMSQSQLAWYPSLIGLGSCAGQILFGLLISKVHNPSEHRKRSGSVGVSNLTYVFGGVLLLNGGITLGLTYAPVPSYLTSIISEPADKDVLIFSTTIGRVFGFICFLLGITDGAFMTLLGPTLEYYLDDTNFPAGLGISLCILGAFNLAGTLIGGHLLDMSGTYYSTNLLAACLPLVGFLIYAIFFLIFYIRRNNSVDFDESTA